MTLSVFKYMLAPCDIVMVTAPEGAKPLTVQMQHGEPQLWMLVDPSKEVVAYHFRVAGTGHPIEIAPERLSYVGTFQIDNGSLVFHVFQILTAHEAEARRLAGEED